jgi:hypothetical protein
MALVGHMGMSHMHPFNSQGEFYQHVFDKNY